jgi:hypothetical protein
VPILRERAEAAEGSDELAAKTWRDIVDAAERLLEKIMIAAEIVEPRVSRVEFTDLFTVRARPPIPAQNKMPEPRGIRRCRLDYRTA